MGLLSSIGKFLKGAVTAPFSGLMGLMKAPGKLISAGSGALSGLSGGLKGLLKGIVGAVPKLLPMAASMAPMLMGLPPIPGLGAGVASLFGGAGSPQQAQRMLPAMASQLFAGMPMTGLGLPGLGQLTGRVGHFGNTSLLSLLGG